MNIIQSIHSELIKLKYAPIYWLIGFICFCCLAIIFTAHIVDINNAVSLGANPWHKMMHVYTGIMAIFISSPFIILLIGAALYIENQSRGWKQVYTIPKSRRYLLLSKLTAILLTILSGMLVLIPLLVVMGYIIGMMFPEYEFSYYAPPFLELLKSILLIFISLLGIIGIQFFLCLKFKGFLVPASFGILAFICGLILSTTNKSIVLLFPYGYPMIARDQGMFKVDKVGIEDLGPFTNVELYSIITFLIFILFSLIMETRKNIN